MSALVRVKRQLDEEPSDAIILCKRRKFNKNSSEEPQLSSAVLKFAGTVQKDENFLEHLRKQSKSDLDSLKENFKKHELNITEKLREETKTNIKNNRYRIVNCFRSTKPDVPEGSDDVDHSNITILEVENESSVKTSVDNVSDKDEQKYVYDLYYTYSDDLGDANMEEFVSIHPLNDTLVFGSFRDNGIYEPESDSSDSNDENNWRNDYPDESDLESINENDMIHAIENVNIDDNLLSSDDGEEGFVYSIDSEAAGFEEAIDESDVHRYGERYARFKARNKPVTTEINPDLYYGDIEEDCDYD